MFAPIPPQRVLLSQARIRGTPYENLQITPSLTNMGPFGNIPTVSEAATSSPEYQERAGRVSALRSSRGIPTGRTAVRRPETPIGPSDGGDSSTAGMTPDIDYDAIRARAIAPSRAIYMNAIRNLMRQPGLGISSPGYGAQLANLSRSLSSDLSDRAMGAEALVSDVRLREMQMQQERELRNRALDIAEKQAPSSLERGLSTTGQILDLASTGADIYGNIRGNNSYGGGGYGGGYGWGGSAIGPSSGFYPTY